MPRAKRRILVAGHDLKFFLGLKEALEETGLFVFRLDEWQGHNVCDEVGKCEDGLAWADLVFCEWCLGNAVWYSRHVSAGQPLFVRFHLAERNTVYPGQLELDRVARIAFVGAHIEREAHQRLGIPAEKTCVVPNLLDLSVFDRPKFEGCFFNLGMLGIVPRRKRVDRALDTLELLRALDDRYCLHIKGGHPANYPWVWNDEGERDYYRAIWSRINQASWGNSVIFDPPGNDVPDWFRMIGHILSPSDFESFHMAIGEGMCSGTQPIVWPWEGADEIWPADGLVGDAREAAERIDALRRAGGLAQDAERCRAFVRERYDRKVVRNRWAELLLGA